MDLLGLYNMISILQQGFGQGVSRIPRKEEGVEDAQVAHEHDETMEGFWRATITAACGSSAQTAGWVWSCRHRSANKAH